MTSSHVLVAICWILAVVVPSVLLAQLLIRWRGHEPDAPVPTSFMLAMGSLTLHATSTLWARWPNDLPWLDAAVEVALATPQVANVVVNARNYYRFRGAKRFVWFCASTTMLFAFLAAFAIFRH